MTLQSVQSNISHGNFISPCLITKEINTDVASSLSSALRSKLYDLTAVVLHYRVPDGGHYAVYMQVATNLNANDKGQPLPHLLAGCGFTSWMVTCHKF
jgi:hypothetical protein